MPGKTDSSLRTRLGQVNIRCIAAISLSVPRRVLILQIPLRHLDVLSTLGRSVRLLKSECRKYPGMHLNVLLRLDLGPSNPPVFQG